MFEAIHWIRYDGHWTCVSGRKLCQPVVLLAIGVVCRLTLPDALCPSSVVSSVHSLPLGVGIALPSHTRPVLVKLRHYSIELAATLLIR